MSSCHLNVIIDGVAVCQIPISEAERVVIGRSLEADIPLGQDPSLSRLHFEVVSVADGFRVKDMGSSNGMYVQGKRVKQALLRDQDVILAGRTTFVVQMSTEGQVVRQPPPAVDQSRSLDSTLDPRDTRFSDETSI